MKFRTSFQTPRSDSKDNGNRPPTAIHWKIPSLRERQSKSTGLNRTQASTEKAPRKDELSLASPSIDTEDHEDDFASSEVEQPPAPVEKDPPGKSQESQVKRSLTRKKAMQDWMQKTGAQLRTQSASWKARGQKLSEGKRGNKKSKVVSGQGLYYSKRNNCLRVRTGEAAIEAQQPAQQPGQHALHIRQRYD